MAATLTSEPAAEHAALVAIGFRFGEKGTHSSRTMMLAELTELLAALPATAKREDYAAAIVEENVLGKHTIATRKLTNQRLGEIYGLDPSVALFRVLRRVWPVDKAGRPLLALLCALARDPLLFATIPAVLRLPVGAELMRTGFLAVLRQAVGTRLNERILDKVARNAASTWSQAGYLKGRVRKIRQRVTPTPGATALALWMGSHEGLVGLSLVDCRWCRVLDRSGAELTPFVLQAKQLGLIQARIGGGVVDVNARGLDPVLGGQRHGQN